MNRSGYVDGYMRKEANIGRIGQAGVGAVKTTADVAESLAPYFLVAPILLGAGAGLTHSKLTSPSDLDKETVQKQLEAAELEEFLAELKRRRAQERIEQESEGKDAPRARSLHI